MRLADLQELSTKELKELAAKEGVTVEGDKRVRLNWLIALEKYFEAKLPILAQTEEYEVTYGKKTRYRFRSKHPQGPWIDIDTPLPKLMWTLMQLSQSKHNVRWQAGVKQFRHACVPVRQCTRPP